MPIKSAFSHTHQQTTPAATWTIVHGLKCKPSVAVSVTYQGNVQSIIPNSVTYPDDNTVVVGFTTPYSGTARLN
jgi:hypothetical protein